MRTVEEYRIDFPSERSHLAKRFETYLSEWTERTSHSGEFYTPQSVVSLIVHLANLRIGDRVYDPCFGTGSFLSSASHLLCEQGKSLSPEQWQHLQEQSIFGIEIQPNLTLIAWARIVLNGVTSPRLQIGDSLERDFPLDRSRDGFDCVLANPPFGGRVHPSASSQYPLSTASITAFFLQHILKSLRPNGRAFCIVPEGLLFRNGSDMKLRELLLAEYSVDAVISLPKGAFLPYTGIKTSLLAISRCPPKQKILFVSSACSESLLGAQSTLARQALSMLINSQRNNALEQQLAEISETLRNKNLESITNSEREQIKNTAAILSLVHEEFEGAQHIKQIAGEQLDKAAWLVDKDTLSTGAWELVVKDKSDDEVSNFLTLFLKARPQAKQVRLGDIAEVMRGIPYDRKMMTDDSEATMPLVRVQDVTAAARNTARHVKRPNKYVLRESIRSAHLDRMLRFNDILITTSGTIGGIGIVGEDTVDAVPTNGVVIVRIKAGHTSPIFLLRMFQTQAYQDWFRSHCTGATIKHLSIEALRNIPIVIPALDEATALARRLHGGEPTRAVIRALEQSTTRSFWSRQLEDDELLNQLAALPGSTKKVDLSSWDLITRWLNHSSQLNIQLQTDSENDPFANWLLIWTRATSELSRAKTIVDPKDRFLLLQSWRDEMYRVNLETSRLERDLFADDSSPPDDVARTTVSQCSLLAKSLEIIWREEISSLAGQTNIVAFVDPVIINASQGKQVEIELRNDGALPVRDMKATTSPIASTFSADYLPTSGSLRWTIQVPPMPPGPITLTLFWEAQRLDGLATEGTLELPLEARSLRAAARGDDFGVSPYIVGPPIETADMFYGRQDILSKIKLALRTEGPANVILFEGNRRAGKSSILKQLLLPNALPGWIPVYCTFQSVKGDKSKAGMPTAEIFYSIARELIIAIHKAQYEFEIPGLGLIQPTESNLNVKIRVMNWKPHFQENALEQLEIVLETVLAATSPKRVLLMLDEFDKIQEGIDNKITSPQVPENIRYLFHTFTHLSGILTGSRRIQRLREEYWHALFGIGNRISAGPLDIEAAYDLVTKPVAGRLVYSRTACERILYLCACHAYLLQSLCHRIFEQCVELDTRSVTVEVVNAAAEKMVEDNENLRTMWESAGNACQRYLTCIIHQLSSGPDRVTFDLLAERLSSDGLETSSIVKDLNELRELDFVKLTEPDTYSIEVPLFSYWISKHIDINSCRAEALKEVEDIIDG
ncbi:N-6 DNA methylase [Candidatus Obscuribacterales bacterium]|nr:N-6 DNA methylase [Candidatus Obscuribacterales bacterium]